MIYRQSKEQREALQEFIVISLLKERGQMLAGDIVRASFGMLSKLTIHSTLIKLYNSGMIRCHRIPDMTPSTYVYEIIQDDNES